MKFLHPYRFHQVGEQIDGLSTLRLITPSTVKKCLMHLCVKNSETACNTDVRAVRHDPVDTLGKVGIE